MVFDWMLEGDMSILLSTLRQGRDLIAEYLQQVFLILPNEI
jgi:hypothetical protein